MSELDIFGKKLEDLRESQLASESARQKSKEEQLLRITEECNLAREEYLRRGRQLAEFVDREILPILQTVNQRYLLGKGEIETQINNETFESGYYGIMGQPDTAEKSTKFINGLQKYKGPNLELSLIWDRHGNSESGSEKKVMLVFDQETSHIRLSTMNTKQTDAPSFQFEDEKLKNKIMDSILSLLENPSSCEWSWSPREDRG